MSSPESTVRKLTVEVIDGRDLLPKDGHGSSSPYVVVEFAGQRKRTKTSVRSLNPKWHEKLEFLVFDPADMEAEELEIEIYHENIQGSAGKKNQFLGRVRIYGSQFTKKGEEGLVYFPLEKKSILSWVRGDIGLRICYHDEVIKKPEKKEESKKKEEVPSPTDTANQSQHEAPPVPLVLVEEDIRKKEVVYSEPMKMQTTASKQSRVISSSSSFNLVEPMQFLFVKVVKTRNLLPCENPNVKVRLGLQTAKTKQVPSENPEWNQVFSFSQGKTEPTLEISVWGNGKEEVFLGGVCFDLSDVPVRENPDGPLAAQWYRLESGACSASSVSGDIMISVWMGTQADDAFPDSWNSEAPHVKYTRSKVYHSPKLWYLRVSIIEAQDLHVGSPKLVRVKLQLGFQSSWTKPSASTGNSSSFSWREDLILVVSEPLDDQLLLLVEECAGKETTHLGHVALDLAAIEQRLDENPLPSKWFNLDGGARINLKLCLEGGYHVLDEAANLSSDFRPTAKQLWRPPIGVLELGILGGRNLLPMKTKGGTRGSTDAYCVAKYGKKWVRTRTITDSFDPRWNEQYTWQVYDPCTVLTIGVFDNWRMFSDDRADYRIGKVRIRVSTLETNRVYTSSYPLLILLHSGVKKMGEVEIAVRFASSALLPEILTTYLQPVLPRMHYLRPIVVQQQELLRNAAIKMVSSWLSRAEPPLGPDVVRYMLDADSHAWSMRRSKCNWFRIMAVISWVLGAANWVNDIRQWRNPVTTFLVHILYLVLVWYPELAAPTGCFYLVMVAAWYRRFRGKGLMGMDVGLSQGASVDGDELDEEFDGVPTGKKDEVVRIRYDRIRALAGRVQTVMGDMAAQGERIQALVCWRDPRATRIFVVVCSAAGLGFYLVPGKMVAVALGFYFLRHPMFRDPMPAPALNFFRRLPSLSDRIL